MFDFGYGGTSHFQPTHTYGRVRGSAVTQGVAYPSPFFDLAHTYLPPTVKQMFKWCRYYYLTQPLIAAVVNKMSEYPITDLVIDTDNKGLRNMWENFFESDIQLRPRLIDIGLYFHCFHGDTKVITDQGVFKIRDMAGKTFNVLSDGGVYRPASFRSYGRQELLEVEFRDGRTVLTTPEHEWPVITSAGNTIKLPTMEIEGRSIPRNVAPRPDQNEDFYEGVRHGFVFGDGTLYNSGSKSKAYFYGDKKQAMVRYFEGVGCEPIQSKSTSCLCVMIHGLPNYYKRLPENSRSASYWYGFVSGFLAADGSVDTHGCVILTQVSRTTLEIIEEQLPRIGMVAGPLRGHWRSSDYGEGEVFYLTLLKQSILPQDLLLPHHRQKFEDNYKPTSYGKFATVRAVRSTGLIDEVFCCNEEETHTFTISNGVLTGNCYGNVLASLMHPFVKWLKCKYCGHTLMAKKATYRFRSYEFHMTCTKCEQTGHALVEDQYLQTSGGTKIILWNPEDIDIIFNPITQETVYFYSLPIQTLNDMAVGRREVIEQLPQVFIDAAKKHKSITLNKDNLFHLKRSSVLSGPRDTGWGTPLVLPVLKDVFYLQIMKKAQECVSLSTLIETCRGLVAADDVNVGDIVRTHTGAWRPVEEKWYRDAHEGELGRRITITGLRPFSSVYSPGHPIFTIRRNEECRRVDTKETQRSSIILKNPHLWEEVLCPSEQIQIGDYLLYPRKLSSTPQTIDVASITGLYSKDGWVYSGGCSEETVDRFSALELGEQVPHDNSGKVAKRIVKEGRTPKRLPACRELTDDLAYILGWYAGDGSTGTGHVDISMGVDDDHYPLMDAVGREFKLSSTIHESKKSKSKSFTFCDVIVTKLIKGLIPGTARIKAVPQSILDGPDSCKLTFLKGLWEADGYVRDENTVLATSSQELAYGVYRLLIHLGCIASIREHHNPSSTIVTTGQIIPATEALQVVVCNASRDRILALWEGKDASEIISGKSGFFWKEYFAARVCSIEEVEERTYIDFKIAEDTTFCTPGVATKNSILLERIVPLTVIFPQQNGSTSDPYTTINLVDWKDHIAQEIQRWRLDRNYIPILPLPIGNQVIGGDGRALLMSQEIKIWSDQIIAGMGVPNEFIYGGLQWSGSNVSLRMLENQFMRYLSGLLLFVKDFLVKGMAAHMGWPTVGIRFKPFKMADDLQRKAFLFQLNSAGKVSDTTLVNDTDLNPEEENELIRKETKSRLESVKMQQIAEAEIAGEAGVINAKYQAKAQTIMMQEQQQAAAGMQGTAPGEPGEDVGSSPVAQPQGSPNEQGGQPQVNPLQQVVQRLRSLSPDAQRTVLTRIEQSNPELARQLQAQFNQGGGIDPSPNTAGKPLPTQLPPRRDAKSAMI